MNFDNLFCYFPTPKIQRAFKGFGKPINALPFSSTKKNSEDMIKQFLTIFNDY